MVLAVREVGFRTRGRWRAIIRIAGPECARCENGEKVLRKIVVESGQECTGGKYDRFEKYDHLWKNDNTQDLLLDILLMR